jgi:hypothetical protein
MNETTFGSDGGQLNATRAENNPPEENGPVPAGNGGNPILEIDLENDVGVLNGENAAANVQVVNVALVDPINFTYLEDYLGANAYKVSVDFSLYTILSNSNG